MCKTNIHPCIENISVALNFNSYYVNLTSFNAVAIAITLFCEIILVPIIN